MRDLLLLKIVTTNIFQSNKEKRVTELQPGSSETEKQTKEASFFVMPGNALKSLHDELKIAIEDSEVSREVMERFGFRCGVGMAKNLKVSETENIQAVCDMLPHLWAQSGFGNLSVECEEGINVIKVTLDDSVEVISKGKEKKGTCNFTKGYIAGLISELLGVRYKGHETKCVATGFEHCELQFKPSSLSTDTAPEKSVSTEEKYELVRGMSYLYLTKGNVDEIFDVFVDKVTHGYEGICISRIFPQKIKFKYNMKNTKIFWLTVEKGGESTIWYPHLGKIHDILVEFLEKSKNPIILIDGIEFLITKNNYKNTLSFLQVIIEKVALHDAILLIPINPNTLQLQELSLLERETAVIKDINQIKKT